MRVEPSARHEAPVSSGNHRQDEIAPSTRRSHVDGVEELRLAHPDWQPWLDVLDRVLREVGDPAWRASVPQPHTRRDREAPLLAGAVIRVEPTLAQRWVHDLFAQAAESGYSTASGIAETSIGGAFALSILEAALCQDVVRLDHLAGRAASQAFRAIATLAALPLLQACGRQWAAAVPPMWRHGYCPVCGAWPALAEAREERKRHLRCARCGTEWGSEAMRCAFCGTGDRDRLELLLDEPGLAQRQIEACSACRGYLKVLGTLEATPRTLVILVDLASIDLDLVALSEGFTRPARPGCRSGLVY